jgi:hypothetical protein
MEIQWNSEHQPLLQQVEPFYPENPFSCRYEKKTKHKTKHKTQNTKNKKKTQKTKNKKNKKTKKQKTKTNKNIKFFGAG